MTLGIWGQVWHSAWFSGTHRRGRAIPKGISPEKDADYS